MGDCGFMFVPYLLLFFILFIYFYVYSICYPAYCKTAYL